MATTDEFVKYDVRYFDEFSKYLNFDKQDMKTLRKCVQMGLVQRERLVELAISKVGGIKMDSTHGQDHADGTDTKTVVSSIRNNNKSKGCWTHSFNVRKIASKNGPLRVVAYNKILDKFHYFFIPHSAFQHCNYTVEIVVEQASGLYVRPQFNGIAKRHRKWWQYEVESFEDMCNTRPGDIRTRNSLVQSQFKKLFDEIV
tara:strand:- start:54 stop:653 length:600 start_codon:yes stop_codon:yes gene_type:complete